MAWTVHGHHVPGTPQTGKHSQRPADCGGVGQCNLCSLEAVVKQQRYVSLHPKKINSSERV